jgi:hypothetical protein
MNDDVYALPAQPPRRGQTPWQLLREFGITVLLAWVGTAVLVAFVVWSCMPRVPHD